MLNLPTPLIISASPQGVHGLVGLACSLSYREEVNTMPIKEQIAAFLAKAKEVKCPKCGQVFQTVERDLTCYVCFTNIKLGGVIN
jgi:hypothetical protein